MTRISIFWHAAVEQNYATFVKDLANELPNSEVILYVPVAWEEFPGRVSVLPKDAFEEAKNLRIVHCKTFGPQSYKFFMWDPLKLFDAFKHSDLVITFTEPYILSALQFVVGKFLSKKKLILFSAQNIKKRFPGVIKLIENMALKSSDAILICNNEAGLVLREKGYLGDLYKLKLGIPETDELKFEDIKAAKGSKHIVYLGRFEREKGVYDILTIAKSDQCADYLFSLYGHGSEYENIKERSKLLPNVEVNKSLRINEVKEILLSAELNLLLSYETKKWKEQFGRIIVEAMDAGTPTIGYNSGEIPHVVGETGFICDQGRTDLVISYIVEFFTKLDMREEKQKMCIYTIKDYYWSNIAHDFANFLEDRYEIER